MKVILKPGGVAVIALCVVCLAMLAARSTTSKAPVVPATAKTDESASKPPAISLLKNGGMEGAFGAVAKALTPKNATISGMVAPGWSDNSEWGAVDVNYAADKTNPRGGNTCQRIEITRVAPFEEAGIGSVIQFVQSTDIPEKGRHRFAIWARASGTMDATIKVRGSDKPYTAYGEKIVVVTPDWQRFEVESMIPEKQQLLVMFCAAKEGATLWVDDATLEPVP